MITKNDLLDFFQNERLEWTNVNLFVKMKNWEENSLKKVQIDQSTANGLYLRYSNIIRSKLWEDIMLINVSEYDWENTNALYYFDTCTYEMEFIKSVSWTIEDLFSIDEISKIWWFILKIWTVSKYCNIYIPYYPIYLMDRDKWAIIMSNSSQFKEMDSSKIIRFNNQIVFLYYNDSELNDEIILSFDFSKIEKNFWYDEVLTNQANSNISLIEDKNLISDIYNLKEYVNNNTALRNKLLKVNANSIVLNKPVEELKTFIEWHSFLKDKCKFDSDWKIDIKSEEKARIFLKIIDDDYLKSDLTDEEYETDKKSIITDKKSKIS